MIDATPHHIGCAVEQLEAGYTTYAGGFGFTRRSSSFEIASQNVRVCFVELGEGFYLELIAPLNEKARLASFIKVGFYHLCFLVEDLSSARAHLSARQFTELPAFTSEAFADNLCQFFVSPQSHLIELAQMPKKTFVDFFLGKSRAIAPHGDDTYREMKTSQRPTVTVITALWFVSAPLVRVGSTAGIIYGVVAARGNPCAAKLDRMGRCRAGDLSRLAPPDAHRMRRRAARLATVSRL